MDINVVTAYDTPQAMVSTPVTLLDANNTMRATEETNLNETVNNAASLKKQSDTMQPDKEKQTASSVAQDIVEKAIEQINKSISTFDREMQVSVHSKTHRIMVKVMDTKENKVIREIPPEKVLDAFAKTLELAGILVDKKS